MKRRAFFFHFNKPASQSAGRPQVSVHFMGACHVVDNVVCRVSTEGRVRKVQPRFVMAGRCERVELVDGVAVIS